MTFGRSFGPRGLGVGFIGTGLLAIGLLGITPPAAADPCEVVDNGSGTITLPPDGCDYLSPSEVHENIDGLPPGTTIELGAIHKDFLCSDRVTCSVLLPPGDCEVPGGGLGGNVDCTDSTAELTITGTGVLGGFSRTIFVPMQIEVHTAPRTPGDAVQSFETEMVQLQGQIFGDPDFDLLRITAGSNNGLPSPGETTLTRLGPPGSNFQVDSFFDITYRIEFQGAPGGVLDGFSGTTQGTIPMRAGDPAPVPDTLDHFQCWQVKDLKNPKFEKRGVTLNDQFTAGTVEVKKLFLVCAPADKDGSGVNDVNTHQCCYKIKGAKLDPPPRVTVTDQFGDHEAEVKKAKFLCQPCSKTVLP